MWGKKKKLKKIAPPSKIQAPQRRATNCLRQGSTVGLLVSESLCAEVVGSHAQGVLDNLSGPVGLAALDCPGSSAGLGKKLQNQVHQLRNTLLASHGCLMLS